MSWCFFLAQCAILYTFVDIFVLCEMQIINADSLYMIFMPPVMAEVINICDLTFTYDIC